MLKRETIKLDVEGAGRPVVNVMVNGKTVKTVELPAPEPVRCEDCGCREELGHFRGCHVDLDDEDLDDEYCDDCCEDYDLCSCEVEMEDDEDEEETEECDGSCNCPECYA